MGVAAASCCFRRDIDPNGAQPLSLKRRELTTGRACRISDFYELGPRLGKGSYGEVKKATLKSTGNVRAVKIIHTGSKSTEKGVMQEVELMRSLQHPNIVRVFNVYQDVLTMYVVMELCVGGDVFEWFASTKNPTEMQACTIMEQILRGVLYLHQQSICHRDLKPENFLLLQEAPIDDNLVKICDFGVSCRCLPGEILTKRVFSGYYVAPEVLRQKYGIECDIWSTGVSMYILLSGAPPFGGNSDHHMMAKILEGTFQMKEEDWSSVSAEAKELVQWMLTMDPARRCTAEQALSHKWFKNKGSLNCALCRNLADRLRAFKRHNKLKKAALHLMARHAEDVHIKELRKAFIALDKNGDGFLSLDEVRDGLHGSGAKDIPHDLQDLLETVSADGKNDAIAYDAFLAAMMTRPQDSDGVIKQVFDSIDTNGSGAICMDEVKQALKTTWVSENGHSPRQNEEVEISEEELEEVMKEIDVNGDGEIDLQEFMDMMRASTPKAGRVLSGLSVPMSARSARTASKNSYVE
mmetsp:Transcript_2403/g.5116  ORF Transcript_2403/g.5116 Transcript_2403/m.5116 type:complete len:523 (+) Transcript_2403:95-1663(+)